MGYCRQILIYILILSFYVPSESSSCAPCSEGMFQCSYTCKCISASSRCNGVHNCLFNDDEDNCYTKPPLPACDFTCELTGMCLESSSRCDGINDCFDDSDEKNCAFCKSGNFLCNNSRCIRSKYVCDGDNDCDDNSDEMFCSHKVQHVTRFVYLISLLVSLIYLMSGKFSTETTTEISASEACYCLNQVQCYSVYESCTDGCFDGYYGDKCAYRDKEQCHCTDKTECFSAYSYFSLITCSSCEEGYTGPRCNGGLQQSRDEESRRHQEFDLPPSYESVATIPLTQPALYPDEPPPSYDSISFQSTSCIRQTQGAVNNGFLSDI
ncbi:hypothetical protein KUTeg_001777 [Tegillarca granosa]|uniref:Uncharacterized protein n=1 Tax=Tegillarca granosa TaxID=220873 RepID=A0ABQ9FWR1_TEGGR|nr:hypothetical protein KUTeg_001777 [Tegillarca granosa]